MLERLFSVKYLRTIKKGFCFLSSTNLNDLQRGGYIKINYGDDDVAYFSVGPSQMVPNIYDNEIGINSLYAKALGIDENEVVTVTEVSTLPTIKSISISPLNKDDFQILEMMSDLVQSTLLNQIKVLNKGQKFIIWVGNSMSVSVNVDDMKPVHPGCLDNLTEVIIKPYHTDFREGNSLVKSNHLQKFSNYVKSTDEFEVDLFEKYADKKQYLFLRIVPFSSLKTEKLFNNIFQLFNVFVLRKSLTSEWATLKSSETPIICSMNTLYSGQDSLEITYVRLCILEDFIDNCEVDVVSTNNIFVSDALFQHFGAKIGTRALLRFENISTADFPSVHEIEIIGKNIYYKSNFYEFFRKTLGKACESGSKVLLCPGVHLDMGDNCTCTMKFKPEEAKVCLVDDAFLRTCKFTLGHEPLVPRDKNDRKVHNKNDFITDILNYDNIINNSLLNCVAKLRNKSYLENVLIVGRPGTGKSTVLNILGNNLSEHPYYVYTENVNCKSLKGKTIESLHKLFSTITSTLLQRHPSALLLDDIHVLCENIPDGESMAQNALYNNRVSEMLHNLFKHYTTTHLISIYATCESLQKLNKNIYQSRGSHLFKSIYTINDFTKNDKIKLFKFLFSEYKFEQLDLDSLAIRTDGFVMQDVVDFTNKAIFESCKEDNERDVIEIKQEHCNIAFESMSVMALNDVNLHSPGKRDFSDVGGLNNVKKILIESLLWPVQYPNLFAKAPLRLQSGLLLYGPPGTGKTILAGAAAKHCGLRLISIKGPELLSKYIGASEQAVRDTFEKAQSAKPCILFFDEFDSLAPRRGHDNTGVTDRVVNQLLTQLDGVESLSGVCVLAATSRPDLLDPALLRPGRLDRQILCPLPNQETRLEILNVLSKNMKLVKGVKFNKIAQQTEGFSGADLQSLLYTAQLSSVEHLLLDNAAVQNTTSDEVTEKQLDDALKKTKPSLTIEERKKYDRIYKKFQGGSTLDFQPGSKATLA